MTLRDYIADHAEDIAQELCQYQKCENCSLGTIDHCVLRRCSEFPVDEELTEEEEFYLGY